MAEIQVGGKALVFGLASHSILSGVAGGTSWDTEAEVTSNAGAGATIEVYITDVNYEKGSDIEETRSQDGEVVNLCYYGFRETATITCIPYGSTKSAAQSENVLPQVGYPLKYVGSATADDDDIGDSSGKFYTITGASKVRTATGKCVWTLNLRKDQGITSHSILAAS